MAEQLELLFTRGANIIELRIARCESRRALERPALVSIFPVCRRAQLVRDAADQLLDAPHRAAREKFWRQLIRRLRKNLAAQRCDAADVDPQLRDFRAAVQRELDGRTGMRRSPGGGGAA